MDQAPRILSLDVSSKTGWATFRDGKPETWGTLFPDKTVEDFGSYPINYVRWAEYTAQRLYEEVISPFLHEAMVDGWPPLEVIIEETNASKEAYSQKRLEYLHFCLVNLFDSYNISPKYVRSGEWRKQVEARQNAEEKALNSKISREKKKRNALIDLDSTLSADQKKKLKRLPIKLDGKVVGRKGRKHVSIRVVKELLGLQFKAKDEDTAEALLAGLGFLRGAAICDGTVNGGKSKKEIASDG